MAEITPGLGFKKVVFPLRECRKQPVQEDLQLPLPGTLAVNTNALTRARAHLRSIGLCWRGETAHRPRLTGLRHESRRAPTEGFPPSCFPLLLSRPTTPPPVWPLICAICSRPGCCFHGFAHLDLSLFDQFISSACSQPAARPAPLFFLPFIAFMERV